MTRIISGQERKVGWGACSLRALRRIPSVLLYGAARGRAVHYFYHSDLNVLRFLLYRSAVE